MTIPGDVGRVLPGIVSGPGAPVAKTPAAPAEGASFGAVLQDSLAQVNHLQHEADRAITQLASGGPQSLHDTMLALEKADLSFRLMMQVRNKIVEAYQEVLRMQV
jgi:flagellar hook-basal body complex protein FliE